MAPLSHPDIKACEHPRLALRFGLALLCAILLVPLIVALSFFGLITLLLFWIVFLAWFSAELLFALFTDNSILVSTLNYPRINILSEEVRSLLGMRKEFRVYVYEQGLFNAFFVKLFHRRAIFINSEILETGVSDDEVRWLVGRFVGYWRTQQDAGIWGWMVRMAQRFVVFNFFILPYERAMVYTGDRLGLAAIGGDIGSAISAMQKLLVGRQLGYSVNPVGVVEQRRLTKGSLFAFLVRVGSAFPSMIARYVDLIAFARRRFRDQFGRFEAVNPGLAQDLDELSGERTAGKSLAKGVGFLLAWMLAGVVTVAAWGGLAMLAGHATPNLSSLFEHPSSDAGGAASTPSPSPAPVSSVPPTVPVAPPAATPAPVQPPAPAEPAPPVQNPPAGPHEISGAIFERQPTADDYAAVYPDLARAKGVSGSGTLRCEVIEGGTLTNCQVVAETPPGSGFGDAALHLTDLVRLAPQTRDGDPVAGNTITFRVPFNLK